MPTQPARQRLLDTAAELMYAQGVHATSVDAILAKAGAGKSQFYHYFKNKDAMIAEVVRVHIARFIEAQEHLLAAMNSLEDLQQWLDNVQRWHARHLSMGGCPIGSMAAELPAEEQSCWQALRLAFDRWQGHVNQAFQRMKTRGDFPPETDCESLAALVIAANQGAALMTKTYQDAEHMKRIHTQLLTSLKARLTLPPTE